jgi:hypothetical protein
MESNIEEIIFAFVEKDRANQLRLTVNTKSLMENSSVLNSKFLNLNNQFSIPKVIAIEDIEKSIFLKMVNCLNGERIDFNTKNVFRLMDAAQKYMVEPLMGSCDKFIIDLVTSDNEYTMIMLDSSLKYNRAAIKEKCLDIILDDPMTFFEDSEFLNIKKDTLKLILTQPKINCTVFCVLRAAKKWLKHNKIATVEKLNDVYAVLKEKLCIEESVLKDKQFYSIRVVSTNDDHKFVKQFRKISETISLPDSSIHLYGLVLVIGVHPDREKEIVASDYLTDTISIDILVRYSGIYEFRTVSRVVNQPLSKLATIKVSNLICV